MASIITKSFRLSSVIDKANDLIRGKNKTVIGDLVIDVCIKEVIKLSSVVTEHPLESKESVADHIYKNSIKLRIEGFITDTPMRIFGIIETPLGENSVPKLINNIKSVLHLNEDASPSLLAYTLLRRIWSNRLLVTVTTKLEVFQNMAIVSLESNRDTNTGGRFEFIAEFVQLQFASVRTTDNGYKGNSVKALANVKKAHGLVDKGKSISATGVDAAKNGFEYFIRQMKLGLF